MNKLTSDQIYCEACSKDKCSVCLIVLCDKHKCPICGAVHGKRHADGHRCWRCGELDLTRKSKQIDI